jgi:aspartate aminotransferase
MPVSVQMKGYAEKSSWIRKMFEEGAKLKAIHGSENVYDFSLGNPDVSPKDDVIAVMERLAREMPHGYMPNAGFEHARRAIAAFVSREYDVEMSAEDIIMTCGAGGAMNVVLRSILDPGDEVIAIAPYFVEYGFYAENFGGRLVAVKSSQDFLPDVGNIRKAITKRTKAIIVNSPNNPTGRVYPQAVFDDLNRLLADHPDILLISDEPYRRIVFDNITLPSVLATIPNSVVVTSASKDLSLAGQRIGYIAVNPIIQDKSTLLGALVMANRILGFVNAPAMMQIVLAECIDKNVDVQKYQKRRDMITAVMDEAGLSYAKPEGAFYLFVKSPIEDDIAFCRALAEERILPVPGTGFGCAGYVRFAYCTSEKAIAGMLPGLKRALEKIRKS